MYGVLVSLQPHQHLLSFNFFNNSHSGRCKVISHCGFDLHFSNEYLFFGAQKSLQMVIAAMKLKAYSLEGKL